MAAEYDAARSHVAIVERRDRRLVRAYGRDPVRMVQGLVSNDVAQATADRSVYATVLTPKGRMIADVRVLRRGEELLLETDAAALEPLSAHLRKFVPPLFARFEDITDTRAVFTVVGPAAPALLERLLGRPTPVERDTVMDVTMPGAGGADGDAAGADVVIVTTSYVDEPCFDIISAAEHGALVWERLTSAGALPMSAATLDVLRIEAGTPVWGAELDDTTIPLEAGLREHAISETKGCYTGQEVIIRILHRGHVNWHLRGLLLGHADAPPHGAALHNDAGRKVGRITSAAWSPRHGAIIALGYIRREVEPRTLLQLADDGGEARVVSLPFPDNAT
jgi:tRNA-modifying protein YgfZ